MTTRAKTNIALDDLPPPRRPGQRGRNRLKGTKIGTPPQIAAQASTQRRWRTNTVRAYGTSSPVRVTDRLCLWYGAWHVRRTRLVLVRNHPHRRYRASDYNLALVTTDTDSTVEQLIARYAARWGIEVAFHDAKHLLGVGQTRTRTPAAVARCVPFGLCCHTLLVLWYVRYGHDPADVVTRRERQPWYRSKTEPALLDMLTKLRRVIIAGRFSPSSPRPATPQEIQEVHQAWALAAA